MKKVVLVTPYFAPKFYGGAVQVYEALFSKQPNLEVHIICEHGSDKEREAQYDAQAKSQFGFQVHRLPRIVFEFNTSQSKFQKLGSLAGYLLSAPKQLKAVLDDIDPDIVVNGGLRWVSWMLNKCPKRYRVYNYIHGEEVTTPALGRYIGKFVLNEQEKAIRNADLNIVVSSFTRQLILDRDVPDERISLLSNFIDLTKFTLPEDKSVLRKQLGHEDGMVFFTIARLIPRKGIADAINALALLHSKGQLPERWQYVIGGNGPEKEKLQRLVVDLELQDHVILKGFMSDEEVIQYYQASDLFLQPNKEVNGDLEGFGIVFLEANACGTPVIGGNSGGVPDAIEDGHSGLIVNPGDINDIARAIADMCQNPERLNAMGQQGYQRARDRFSITKRRTEFEQLVLAES